MIKCRLKRRAAWEDVPAEPEVATNEYTNVEFTMDFDIQARVKTKRIDVPAEMDGQLADLVKTAFNGYGDHQHSGVNSVANVLTRALNRKLSEFQRDNQDKASFKFRVPGKEPVFSMSCSATYESGHVKLLFRALLDSSVVLDDEHAQEFANEVKSQLGGLSGFTTSMDRRLNDTFRGRDDLRYETADFGEITGFAMTLTGCEGVVMTGRFGAKVTAAMRRRAKVLARFSLGAEEIARLNGARRAPRARR